LSAALGATGCIVEKSKMPDVFDRDLQRLGILGGKCLSPSPKRQLSAELLVIVLAILLPLGLACWRVATDSLTDKAILSLDWPEARRPGASVEVNGVARVIPPSGQLEYVVPPGEIRVSLDVPGYKPFEQTVFAKARQNTLVHIPWDELDVTNQLPDAGLQTAATGASSAPATIVANISPSPAAPQVENHTAISPPAGPSAPAQNNIAAASPLNQSSPSIIPSRTVESAASAAQAANASPSQVLPLGRIVPAGKIVAVRPALPVRNVMLAVRGAPAADVAPTQEKQETGVAEVPSLDRTVGISSSSGSPKLATASDLAAASMKPIEVAADAETDRLVGEAWGLIDRGDYDLGRSRLLKARERSRTDPRVDFSLGLLDGMVNADWASAEKKLADCVRRNPDNVPLLNNLAVAELHNRRDMEAAKHWKTIVSQHAATAEVVQNLGRARYLIKLEDNRKNAAVLKTLDDLYAEVAVAASLSARPEAGFRIMGLLLADGTSVGWSNPRRMIDTSPLVVASAPASSHATASSPGTTGSGNSKAGGVAPMGNDPRASQAGAVQSGAFPSGAGGYPTSNPNAPGSLRYGRTRY
jgi:hypothetical protein